MRKRIQVKISLMQFRKVLQNKILLIQRHSMTKTIINLISKSAAMMKANTKTKIKKFQRMMK